MKIEMKTLLSLILFFYSSMITICQNTFNLAEENRLMEETISTENNISESNFVSYKTLGISPGYSRSELKLNTISNLITDTLTFMNLSIQLKHN